LQNWVILQAKVWLANRLGDRMGQAKQAFFKSYGLAVGA